ncbi:MAG: hypothetical protein ABL994_12980 [Verrucomicrobiales bacterium]
MSYDISLYRRDFLKRAIESNLGDWTSADSIPASVIESIVSTAEQQGFAREPVDDAFVAFCRQEGFKPGLEFTTDTPTLLAQLSILPGQIAFSIPYGDRATASVDFCVRFARYLATTHDLGFHDPQEGEALYEPTVA